MYSLNEKHVVITGASRGIGAAIADSFDQLGAKLTLIGRSQEALAKKCSTLQSATAKCLDVTDETGVETAFAEITATSGQIDILINNAGAAESTPIHKMTSADWHHMINTNLNSSYFCTRQVVDNMRKNNWGRIINIASTAGLTGYSYVTAYCAAKHGVVGFTKALALELAQTGITVNTVCPGFTETDLLQDSIKKIMDKTGMSQTDAEESLKKHNPQNRLIQPSEVADTVIWLCSSGAESITGQAIAVAGGEIL